MLKKLSNYVHQSILANYNKIGNKETTIEDAAFLTFLIWVENFLLAIFLVFATVSITLFTRKEIIPLIW
tara:strand:- start:22 stop:228 length:207 start_codon:yes stop_codon:yes gene_type:complete